MEARKITKPLFDVLLAVVVIFIGVKFNGWLASQKKAPERNFSFNTTRIVPVSEVSYSTVPFYIDGNGRVIAANSVDISAEVSGEVQGGSVILKKGNTFSQGALLFKIDNDEARYNLFAQKSQFLTSLAGILADIKIDFPDAYNKWLNYFESIDVEQSLPALPATESPAEKTFLATKGVLDQYYSIVSAEERLSKYSVYAPYSGIISEVFVEAGGTVNPGTPVINISSSKEVELEVPVRNEDLQYIKVGDRAFVVIPGIDSPATATVVRISDIIDVRSQSFLAFVRLDQPGAGLKEGMYTTVQIEGGEIDQSMRFPRKAVFQEELVYVVRDSMIYAEAVEIIRKGSKENIIRGLEPGALVVNDAIVNAYDGMKVSPMISNSAE